MDGVRRHAWSWGLGVIVALSATISLSLVGSARSAPAPSFEQAERSAVLEVYAAQSRLARARNASEVLSAEAEELRRLESRLDGHLALVRKSQQATQARIARLLRALYESDRHVDPIAIFFGATSLDEALEGVDSLSQAAALHRRLAAEAVSRELELDAALQRATESRRAAEDAAASAVDAAATLERTLAEHSATLDRIRRQHRLSEARAAQLEQQATAAQTKSEELTAEAATPEATAPTTETNTAPAETPVPTVDADGTRQLTVDAVAYHLPGNTASGLPVGVGVIAVDPTVIPLGTRVFVPGYGPAVAADTGSAIKGLIIDLWMPSTAEARAWGRRTVTITIYG